jgi:hypothetical protein
MTGQTPADRLRAAPGSHVVVVGEDDADPLRAGLARLTTPDAPVLVVSTDVRPADVVVLHDEVAPPGAPSPVVVDCTDGDARGAANARVVAADPDVPSVGETTTGLLDESPVAGLCLDSLSTVVAHASVQQTYKLLYLLASAARSREVPGVYTWDGPVEQKTLRVLARAVDDTVSLDESSPDPGG